MSEVRMRAKYVKIHVASAVGVAERWRRERLRGSEWVRPEDHQIYLSLNALGKSITIEQAAEVIGNKSWSYISCTGCSDYVARAIEIGEYEAKPFCETCIREAFHVLIGDSK